MKRSFRLSLLILLLSLLTASVMAHPIDNIPIPALAVKETIKMYVAAGIRHIFIGPDHILFVLGLILMGGRLRQLIKIITAFTIAHSLTLTVATLGILTPSARLIEPLIALSIICVGVDNLFAGPAHASDPPLRDWRPFFAFGFGLVHGFGFASVLQEFGLPRTQLIPALISFNGGVEIGQIVIVLSATPILLFFGQKSPKVRQGIIRYGSILISLAGLFWFVQRVFF